jgi:dTDP-4-dehydrorhamnose reductase
MKNVLVLGASGMLGSMVIDYLSTMRGMRLTGALRSSGVLNRFRRLYPEVNWVPFSYSIDTRIRSFEILGQQDWIVNAVGITKPLIRDDNPVQIEDAVTVNCLLPHDLGRYASSVGARVLQIATDCVYSGAKGCYKESDVHDAVDVYGKTKSIGESWQSNVHHVRCSIIGPEPKDFKFLIEWFIRQPQGASVNGFTNHSWNGVTTLHFTKLCQGIIETDTELQHMQHVVAGSTVTKAQMLHNLATAYGREDISISDVEAKTSVERTLATENPGFNAMLWRAAGYETIPTVSQMIKELSEYGYRGAEEA